MYIIIQYDCLTIVGQMAKIFSSLQRQNLSEQVVRQIGLSLMRNDFKPGDALLSEPGLSTVASACRMQLTPSNSTFLQIYNFTPRYAQPLITNFCKRS